MREILLPQRLKHAESRQNAEVETPRSAQSGIRTQLS